MTPEELLKRLAVLILQDVQISDTDDVYDLFYNTLRRIYNDDDFYIRQEVFRCGMEWNELTHELRAHLPTPDGIKQLEFGEDAS